MKEIRTLYPGGKIKAVTFSYDDGVIQDKKLIDILNAHGLKGTFNLCAGSLKNPAEWEAVEGREPIRGINEEELRTWYQGHEVAVHGLNHPFWSAIPRERALYEMLQDKMELERLVGYPVRGLVYPYGSRDADVLAIARALGMAYGRNVGEEALFQLPQDPMNWMPTRHHNAPDLMERAKAFVSQRFNTMALFCVWGHTFEFANQHNWHVIEEFCNFISGREEIWYATNIEIFDYISASKELICTSDCSILYNPTAITIALDVEGERVDVHAGETVRL